MLVSLLTANLLEIELNKQLSCCFVYYNKRFRERCAIQKRLLIPFFRWEINAKAAKPRVIPKCLSGIIPISWEVFFSHSEKMLVLIP